MTIDDKLNLITLLKAVRPFIETASNNAQMAHDNEEGDQFYHYSVIMETAQILHRLDKSIDVLGGD
jgi:hypothetical protein